MNLTPDELFFFNEHPNALTLYVPLRAQLLAAGESVRVEVKKTQISFFTRRMFACVSFLPVRRTKERPQTFVTLTLGLSARLDSPRVDASSQPRPGRWTHHILLSREEELDEELRGWIHASAAFADSKR